MNSIRYWAAAVGVMLTIIVVFRGLVRSHYRTKGHLTAVSSAAEWLVALVWAAFSYAYMPADWPVSHVHPVLQMTGWLCIGVGTPLMLVSMVWLGFRRMHGLAVETLIRTGPYRMTRNPQIVGFVLAMIGFLLLWPSWHMLVSLALLGFFSHLMVLTEEEHLGARHGDLYRWYCQQSPRYLKFPGWNAGVNADLPLNDSASQPGA